MSTKTHIRRRRGSRRRSPLRWRPRSRLSAATRSSFLDLRADLAAFLEKESHVSGLRRRICGRRTGRAGDVAPVPNFGGPGQALVLLRPADVPGIRAGHVRRMGGGSGRRTSRSTRQSRCGAAAVRPRWCCSRARTTGVALPLEAIDDRNRSASSGPEEGEHRRRRRSVRGIPPGGTPSALELLEKHPHLV